MNRVHAARCRSRVSAAAILIAAAALFATRAARADFPFPPTPHELHHEVRALVHDVLRTLDRIPVEIHGGYVGNLEPFLVGNVYFGPHRHYHATYSFPVWLDGSVYYRPYVYCNSRLYGSYDVRPQFWSGWGVESQGHWCGHHHAYYPSAHACFRPQVRRRYDDRHDWGYRSGVGSGYRPQYHSHNGSGYRSSEGSHSGSHDRSRNGSRNGSHDGSHNRPDDPRRHDSNGHDDSGRHRH